MGEPAGGRPLAFLVGETCGEDCRLRLREYSLSSRPLPLVGETSSEPSSDDGEAERPASDGALVLEFDRCAPRRELASPMHELK